MTERAPLCRCLRPADLLCPRCAEPVCSRCARSPICAKCGEFLLFEPDRFIEWLDAHLSDQESMRASEKIA